MPTYDFFDEETENEVTIETNDEFCWINHYNLDSKNVKRFVILLKHATSKAKNSKCTKFKQLVNGYEWETFLKEDKRWNVMNQVDNNVFEISCSIDDAPICIMRGFGFGEK